MQYVICMIVPFKQAKFGCFYIYVFEIWKKKSHIIISWSINLWFGFIRRRSAHHYVGLILFPHHTI